MLKNSSSLLYPDLRSGGMTITDLHNMVQPIVLTESVPAVIVDQFDTARNVFVYSWFVYEFTMLAEQQCYCALEMALRHRLDPATKPNTTKSPGLHQLLKRATAQGVLRRQDFEISIPGGGSRCQLDDIVQGRNHLMHGNINLLPQYALEVIKLCAKIINKLFDSSAASSPTS